MIVHLSDDFKIAVTQHNWTLSEFRDVQTKSGEVVKKWIVAGYYPGFKSAVKDIPDHLCGRLKELSEVIDRLNKLADDFQPVVSKEIEDAKRV